MSACRASKPFHRLQLALVLGGLLGGAPAGAAVPKEQLVHAMDATVLVKVTRSFRGRQIPASGSGFFISPGGLVLTNWHVVAGQVEINYDGIATEVATTVGEIQVVVGSGTGKELVLSARTVALDRPRDLALLRVMTRASAWLQPSGREGVDMMETVWAIGFPHGELLASINANPEATVTGGRVTALRRDEKGQLDKLQTDAALSPGNSGGPVLDDFGDVVGVAWAHISGSANTGFAIHLPKLRAFLDEHQVAVRVEANGIFVRSTPLKVTVAPEIRSLEGLSCRVVLSGDNIDPVAVELVRSGDGFAGTVTVPERRAGSVDPPGYTLRLRLGASDGSGAVDRTVKLPIHSESEAPKVATDRDPAVVLRDRTLFANRQEQGPIRAPESGGEGVSARQPGLADVARTVKLKRDAAGNAVIDNQALAASSFVAIPEHYTGLPAGPLRFLAERFDEAEAALTAARRSSDRRPTSSYYSGHTYSTTQGYGSNDSSATAAKTARGDIQTALRVYTDVRKDAKESMLCRCASGRWDLSINTSRCEGCELPQPPAP